MNARKDALSRTNQLLARCCPIMALFTDKICPASSRVEANDGTPRVPISSGCFSSSNVVASVFKFRGNVAAVGEFSDGLFCGPLRINTLQTQGRRPAGQASLLQSTRVRLSAIAGMQKNLPHLVSIFRASSLSTVFVCLATSTNWIEGK